MDTSTTTDLQPTDRALQERVLGALDFAAVDRAAVGVTVSHGVVTLQGRVKSRRQVWLAEQAAYSTPGVLGIANELHVEEGYGDNDSKIAEAAVNTLRWYRSVSAENVKVIVSAGYITLCGVVEDASQRGAVERAVRGLGGVRGVWNALKIQQAQESCAPQATATSRWAN